MTVELLLAIIGIAALVVGAGELLLLLVRVRRNRDVVMHRLNQASGAPEGGTTPLPRPFTPWGPLRPPGGRR